MRFTIGRLWIRPDRRDEYLNRAKAFVETSRKEEGCVYYDLGAMHDDPDGIVLVEGWTTGAQHAAHTAAPHFKAFRSVFEEFVLRATFEEIDSDLVHRIDVDFSQND